MVTLFLFYHGETELNWLASQDGRADDAIWLPKSKCHPVKDVDLEAGDEYEFEVPEWLAIKEGLV